MPEKTFAGLVGYDNAGRQSNAREMQEAVSNYLAIIIPRRLNYTNEDFINKFIIHEIVLKVC